jgi:hypothetical protein
MQVASLPTVAGRATLQVMMRSSRAERRRRAQGQGSICRIGRGAARVSHTGGRWRQGR